MTRGFPPSRALRLTSALALLIVTGVGLRLLSTPISAADLSLVRDLAGERTGGLTALAHGFSWLGRSTVLVPGAVAIGFAAMICGLRAQALATLLAVVGAIIIQNVDKGIVDRPRPPVAELERVSGTSFPSGHATEATAFWLVLLIAIRLAPWSRPVKLGATSLGCVIIAGVALSRVYLGVHYPTDVVAGALLGGTWAAVTAAVLLHTGPDRPPDPDRRL